MENLKKDILVNKGVDLQAGPHIVTNGPDFDTPLGYYVDMPDYAYSSFFYSLANARRHCNYDVIGREVYRNKFDDRL